MYTMLLLAKGERVKGVYSTLWELCQSTSCYRMQSY